MKPDLTKQISDIIDAADSKELKEKILSWVEAHCDNTSKLILIWVDKDKDLHIQGHDVTLMEAVGMLSVAIDETKEMMYGDDE